MVVIGFVFILFMPTPARLAVTAMMRTSIVRNAFGRQRVLKCCTLVACIYASRVRVSASNSL